MPLETTKPDPETVAACARLRITPEERQRLFAEAQPFDLEAWRRERGPSTPEELAEMEDLLRERQEEREASRASEAGLGR